MAIVFELVLDFGADKDAAAECLEWLKSKSEPIQIDEFNIVVHQPLLSHYPHFNPIDFKVSLIPANIGICVAIDDDTGPLPLTDKQLSRLGMALYDRLRGAPNYKLAKVGWDVDFLLDMHELNSVWAAEIGDGTFAGLVIQTSLISQLPPSSHFVQFDFDHVWIPYSGSRAISR
jgi:hypothetical protein